jgi:UDP-glucose:(heptosyl)LPS alpha-1,3-glucosyltransferase
MVVGKESRVGKYYRKSRHLGISKRVIFAGMQKDVVPYYAAADAFVLPTLYDAFANSVLEAMASSLPVITSFKCGAVDIIENERNGFVCDSLDTGTIIRYMHLMRDPAVRKSVGDAGRTTVAGFTTENMSKHLYTLYEKILD